MSTAEPPLSQKCKDAYAGLAALEAYAATLPSAQRAIMNAMIAANRVLINQECGKSSR